MDGIKFQPLTSEQKSRLDEKGNRVWTNEELKIIRNNLAAHDGIRNIRQRRCAVRDCRFVIGGMKENFALPVLGDVCEICYYMFQALKHFRLKDTNYFVNLHDQWKRDNDYNDPKRRDKLGL